VLRLVTPAPEPRVFCPIDPTVAPGVAAQEPPRRKQASLEEAVRVKRVNRVLRAARVELARSGRRQQAERMAPDLDDRNSHVPRAARPHAMAFPSTSFT
jgi:hypothetical protein